MWTTPLSENQPIFQSTAPSEVTHKWWSTAYRVTGINRAWKGFGQLDEDGQPAPSSCLRFPRWPQEKTAPAAIEPSPRCHSGDWYPEISWSFWHDLFSSWSWGLHVISLCNKTAFTEQKRPRCHDTGTGPWPKFVANRHSAENHWQSQTVHPRAGHAAHGNNLLGNINKIKRNKNEKRPHTGRSHGANSKVSKKMDSPASTWVYLGVPTKVLDLEAQV